MNVPRSKQQLVDPTHDLQQQQAVQYENMTHKNSRHMSCYALAGMLSRSLVLVPAELVDSNELTFQLSLLYSGSAILTTWKNI